ncbi:MAG: hypothetical protein BRC36_09925 [Cyanobacteria bacterium QH_2_48_84]|jgi:hypothetical protein|nr:MAG: hypothetical protein BRC36_09925 [Cyanobacteria bacterium QH_2_48_84]
MSQEKYDTSPEEENTQPEETEGESVDDKAVDPRDLVMKGRKYKSPEETVDEPAVTPEMLDEPQNDRDDLTRE